MIFQVFQGISLGMLNFVGDFYFIAKNFCPLTDF